MVPRNPTTRYTRQPAKQGGTNTVGADEYDNSSAAREHRSPEQHHIILHSTLCGFWTTWAGPALNSFGDSEITWKQGLRRTRSPALTLLRTRQDAIGIRFRRRLGGESGRSPADFGSIAVMIRRPRLGRVGRAICASAAAMIFLVVLAVACSGESSPAPPQEFPDRSTVGQGADHRMTVPAAGTDRRTTVLAAGDELTPRHVIA